MQVFDPLQRCFGSRNRHIIITTLPEGFSGVVFGLKKPRSIFLESSKAIRNRRAFFRLIEKRMEMVGHQNIAKTKDAVLTSVEFKGFKNSSAERVVGEPLSPNGCNRSCEMKAMGKTDLCMSSAQNDLSDCERVRRPASAS